MTSPVHGSVADLYYNGKVLSQFFKTAQFASKRDTADTTTFKKTTKSFIPGLMDNTLQADGFLDIDSTLTGLTGAAAIGLGAESNLVQDALNSVVGTPSFVTYFPKGAQNGNEGYSLYCHASSVEVSDDIGNVAAIVAQFQGTKGFMRGVVVATGSPTSPSSVVDGGLGAATINSNATAVIQVTTSSSLSFKIQDSADNTTWADVGSATSAASAGAYRLEQPSVRRYVRLTWTGTGTFTALLARGRF